MRRLLAVAVLTMMMFALSQAQRAGTFVGSLGIGLTAAQSDFADNTIGFAGGSGFGLEAGMQFYLWRGFSIGGFVNYMRFGSTFETQQGRLNFDFTQLGGQAKMNLFGVPDGVLYLTGGGGMFTPNAHYYIPENSYDLPGDTTGYFGFGGLGLSSRTDMKTIYEFEIRYNMARAGYSLETVSSNVWDFIYVGVKIGFASKGKETPPRF